MTSAWPWGCINAPIILQQEAGDDGVIGLFASSQTVVTGGVQGEVGPPVLQGDGRAGDGHAGAEGGVVALNEGDHVARFIGGTQMDGAAAAGVPGFGLQGLVRDEGPAGGQIVGAEQLIHCGLHVAEVGHIGLGVGKGQLDGLHHLVIVLGALPVLRHGHPVQNA